MRNFLPVSLLLLSLLLFSALSYKPVKAGPPIYRCSRELKFLTGYKIVGSSSVYEAMGNGYPKYVRLLNGQTFVISGLGIGMLDYQDVVIFKFDPAEDIKETINKKIPAEYLTEYKLLIEDDVYSAKLLQN